MEKNLLWLKSFAVPYIIAGIWMGRLGFPNRVLRTRFNPQRLGRFAPLSFPAYGGKIQATRFAGGR
jgi:hypothetical protein